MWGRGNDQRGASTEISKMSAYAPNVSLCILKRIKIWYGRQKVAIEIQKSRLGGRKTYNLIESTFLSKNWSSPRVLYISYLSPRVLFGIYSSPQVFL